MANGNEILLQLKAENDQLKSKLTDSGKSVDKLTKRLRKTGDTFKKIGGLIATYFGARAIKAFINLAGEVDSVSSSFKNLAASAKGGSKGLLEALQIASQGTVSNLDIMKTSNLALQLMGEQVADQLPQMMEIAMATAKSSGKKTAEMFNDIVVASGRQSIMILDNLGISSSVASKYQDEFASSLGKTRDKLTQTQKAQGFFYAVMKAGNEIMDKTGRGSLTFGQRLQIVQARMHNAATSASNILLPALENVLEAFTDMKTGGGNVFTSLIKQVAHFINKFGYSVKLIDAWISKTSDMDKKNEENAEKTREMLKTMVIYLKAMSKETEYGAEGWKKFARQIAISSDKYTNLKKAMDAGFTKEHVSLVKSYYEALKVSSFAIQDGVDSQKTYSQKRIKVEEDYQRRKKEIEEGGAKREATANRKRQQEKLKLAENDRAEMIKARVQYLEYTGQFDQAELLKEQEKNALLLATKTKFETDSFAIETAYEQKKVIAQAKGLEARRKADLAYFNAKVSLHFAEFGVVQSIASMGTTLMQSSNKKLFKLGKGLAFAQASMNTFQAVTKVFAQWGWPFGAIFGAVAAAALGVQLHSIKRQKIPSYEKGRVPVLEGGRMPQDHFPAFIGQKEFVINEQSSRSNYDLLKWIQQNPGKEAGSGGGGGAVYNFNGPVLGWDDFQDKMDNMRNEKAGLMGAENYSRGGVYK